VFHRSAQMDRLLIFESIIGTRSIYFLLVLIAIFYSCGKDGQDKKDVVKFNSKQFSISISHNELSSYNDSDIYHADGVDYFLAYNYSTHAIDIFDLERLQKYNTISLDYQGPNGISSVGSGIVANKNLIVAINSNIIIHVFNHEGIQVHKFIFSEFKQIRGFENEEGKVIDAEGFALGPSEAVFGNFLEKSLLTENNILILPVFPFQKRTSPTYYDQLRLLIIDLNQKKPKPIWLNAKYPDSFQKRFYGDFDIPQISYLNNRLIYNFPASNELFVMNEDSTFRSIKLDLNEEMEEIPDISFAQYNDYAGRRFDYFFHSPRFYIPLYDPVHQYYYIVYKKMTDPRGKTKKESSKLKYTRNFLGIFDNNFTYLNSIKLPDYVTPIYNLTDQGIVFSYNSYGVKSESELPFYLLQVEK
jgi:hypothetical protein